MSDNSNALRSEIAFLNPVSNLIPSLSIETYIQRDSGVSRMRLVFSSWVPFPEEPGIIPLAWSLPIKGE